MALNYCPACGTTVESGSAFCPNCGTAISAAAQPVQPQPSVANPSGATQAYGNTTGPFGANLDRPLSVGQFMGMLVLSGIPLVGIVLLLVWAFGDGVNTNKKNYARACLILAVIGIILSIVLSVMLATVFSTAYSSFSREFY